VLGAALLAGGAALVLRRRRPARIERVELVFADGAAVTLTPPAPEAERLLGLARETLRAART